MIKKFYITTSIVYTNDFPHIGFALELVQADVVARYHRILGNDVWFLTGTDEHGQKIVQSAQEVKKSPKKFCNEIAMKVIELTKILNLSNNDFIRTTDQKRHWPAVKKVWLKLRKNGDIYKRKYKGFYCVGCEAFITKKDLVNGKCVFHQKKPEIIEEENYFFRLSKYSKQIEKIIKQEKIKIIPTSRQKEMLNFIKRGLEDISFSRPRKDLKWGIPVPDDDTQTIYVWGDALVNYISVIGYEKNSNKFKKYWPADVHCIGKDIQKFHSLIWPGMLLSLKLPLPKTIFIHGFVTSDGQKMSKSLGNVVNPFELVKKYGADAVRYFLLREISPTEDGDFTYEKFEGRYNADLASGLGNLAARVIAMAIKRKVQSAKRKTTTQNSKLNQIISKIQKNYKKSLDEFKFNEALVAIWELISFCDKYIEKERPWEESEKQEQVISNLLFAIQEIAKLIEPFMPETSERIFTLLNTEHSIYQNKLSARLPKGHLIGTKQIKTKKSESLFPRLLVEDRG